MQRIGGRAQPVAPQASIRGGASVAETGGPDAEVAVIGTGVMGSMALWRLAERGVSVLGFEQFQPGHNRGSSHGESRVFRVASHEDPRYVPLALQALDLWRDLERASGAKLLTMTGIHYIGPPEGKIVSGARRSAQEHGLRYHLLDREQMQRRFPQHRLNPEDVAVYQDAAGILLPEAAILAATRRAETLGACLLRNTRVERIERAGGFVEVSTGASTYRVRRVVVAVGSWLGGFLPDLELPVEVARQVLAWFPIRSSEDFRPERLPVFIQEVREGNSRYGFPTLDGKTVKIAVRHEGEATTPDTVDREVHARDLVPLQTFIDQHLVGTVPRAARAQVCLYTNTPDHHFLVGSPPDKPWMLVLGGFSGHGFKYSPLIGDAAAGWTQSGGLNPLLDFFALDRFQRARIVNG
jgi:sarcosine oxidase